MDEIENQFVNAREAQDFINARPDPVDRAVLWIAYETMIFRMGPSEIAGQFDVLFLMRILSEMLKDRDRLLRVLSGSFPDD